MKRREVRLKKRRGRGAGPPQWETKDDPLRNGGRKAATAQESRRGCRRGSKRKGGEKTPDKIRQHKPKANGQTKIV